VVGREMDLKEKKPDRILTKKVLEDFSILNRNDDVSEVRRSLDQLACFTQIEDDAAELISNESVFDLRDDFLNFSGLKFLSDTASEHIGKIKAAGLDLSGLESVSNRSAANLSRYYGGFIPGHLSLSGLKFLSDAVAERLSRSGASLNLDGLTSISDAAAASLSKSQGGLSLNGLISLSDFAAENFLLVLVNTYLWMA